MIEAPTLPTTMVRHLAPFVPLFVKTVWQNAQVLLVGTILAPGKRTVASALRALARTDLLDGRSRPGSEGDLQGQAQEDGTSPGLGLVRRALPEAFSRGGSVLLRVSIMP